MATMLEVIKRSPIKIDEIIKERKELFKDFIEKNKDKDFKEIVLIGSGSSYSTCLSARDFVEKASGLETFVMLPNVFINKTQYNSDTLYVFVSQTGTSSLVLKCADRLHELGQKSLALCGDKDAPLVKACDYFALIDLGYEEYSYATLGFACSLLTEMLLGLEIGVTRNYLTQDQYDAYIEEINKVANSNMDTIEKTITWFNKEKDNLLKAQNFILFGGNALWGIANEGALKIMEITKTYISMGFEMDDGMHGPNYCFDERTIVFALNDGKDNDNAISLMNLMKKEYQSGYMIGLNPMDDKDLLLDFKTINFTNLEILPFVQVLAYLLAVIIGMPIYEKTDPRINTTKGKGYFNMHEIK